MKPRLLPLGDSALLIQLGDEIDPALNRQVHAFERRLRADRLPGVIESVPAYASILVHYDPLQLNLRQVSEWAATEAEVAETETASNPRTIEVPVRYGGADGPDLDSIAKRHGISVDEVIRIHTSRDYIVYMMGFTPGFPYMGRLDEAIATPRLETPRTLVPAGSVGIAGAQTGIYPIDSPGGWRILGRTSLRLLDPDAEQPFLFSPGDTVRFVAEELNA